MQLPRAQSNNLKLLGLSSLTHQDLYILCICCIIAIYSVFPLWADLLFCLFHGICLYRMNNVRLPLLQLLLLLLFCKNTHTYTQTIPHTYWGPTAGLAVGVSCLAIPLAGGVRPLWVSLGLHHAECCSEPSQKHLGYLPPSSQRLLFSRWVWNHTIWPYNVIQLFPIWISGLFFYSIFFSLRKWHKRYGGTTHARCSYYSGVLYPVRSKHWVIFISYW